MMFEMRNEERLVQTETKTKVDGCGMGCGVERLPPGKFKRRDKGPQPVYHAGFIEGRRLGGLVRSLVRSRL